MTRDQIAKTSAKLEEVCSFMRNTAFTFASEALRAQAAARAALVKNSRVSCAILFLAEEARKTLPTSPRLAARQAQLADKLSTQPIPPRHNNDIFETLFDREISNLLELRPGQWLVSVDELWTPENSLTNPINFGTVRWNLRKHFAQCKTALKKTLAPLDLVAAAPLVTFTQRAVRLETDDVCEFFTDELVDKWITQERARIEQKCTGSRASAEIFMAQYYGKTRMANRRSFARSADELASMDGYLLGMAMAALDLMKLLSDLKSA